MNDLKILILLSHLKGGGVERVTFNLATKWRNAGADVIIATLQSEEHDVYPVIPEGIRRIALNVSGRSSSLFSTLRNSIAPLISIRQLLRRERPDIVIGMTTIPAIGLALARTGDEVAIGAKHFHPPREPLGKVWNFVRRYSYARLDAVVALTMQSAEWFRENTHARKVVAIPNWVSLPLPDNKPRINPKDVIPAGKKLLLAIGRIHEQKRFNRLLDAFEQVVPSHPDWHLVILGEDSVPWRKKILRKKLETQISRLGLTRQVDLPGFAGNVADWYRAADALILTSNHEGFPMVLLEAMAHGCPPVSVDCDTGPRDIIRNGENGLLVPQNDLNALVDGLDRMLSDDALRTRLALKAVEVLETYSPTRVDARWQNLFDNLRRKDSVQKMRT